MVVQGEVLALLVIATAAPLVAALVELLGKRHAAKARRGRS